jgi:ribosomal protein S18 acetylase RimI-like enzyme
LFLAADLWFHYPMHQDMEIRLLTNVGFSVLYQAFAEAFSDYIVPLQPNEDQLREMFTRRGVDYAISAGAFIGQELVGFTFNAVDDYEGIRTIYDSASGVLPAYRRQGISDRIFRFLLPQLKGIQAKQYLLEVVERNTAALKLYEKIGFKIWRKFDVFVGVVNKEARKASDFVIRDVTPDWDSWETIWDWEPSWQNSSASIRRSRKEKIFCGVFLKERCIGYGIVYPSSGDVPQFCIAPDYRRRGAGRSLMHALQTRTTRELRLLNIENGSEATVRFIEKCGISKFGSQFEMRMPL